MSVGGFVRTSSGPPGPQGEQGIQGIPGSVNVTAGAALPGSPVEGQLFSLIVDDANGIEWMFRYRSSTNTWRFVGGAPLFKQFVGTLTTTSTVFATATNGPTLTLPNVGTSLDLDIQFGASEFTGTVAINTGVFVSGALVSSSAAFFFANIAGSKATVSSKLRTLAALAGARVDQVFNTNSGTSSFSNPFLSILPVQIHP